MWPLVRQARYLGRYRQIAQILVSHGFGYLVEQLGLVSLLSLPRRVILRVPPPTPLGAAERLCQALVALGPTFVKLGQILSTRPDLLPPDFIAELDKLQDTVPPFPGSIAITTIEAELGQPISDLFREFCLEPLAAASLGQVHAAVLHSGERVAVKVQRPDISIHVATDLAILADLAALAQERTSWGTKYDLVDLTWEFSATLRGELDYRREGRNADRFRRNFTDSPLVYIPRIYWDYTSTRVLTSEYLDGVKINDIAGLERAGINRIGLAHNSMQLILQEVFSHGFFHGDPHPGNFFALPGEVIGVVDFGQVGMLDRETTNQLLLLLVSLVNHDNNGVLRALERIGIVARRDVTPALCRDVQRFTERFVDLPLTELSAQETAEELLALVQRHHLRMPGPMALLLKAIIMMEGTGLQLDPNLDVFGIARPYARQAIDEQISPEAMSKRLFEHGRSLSEAALELPYQLSEALERLNDGEVRVQSRELELRRVAQALVSAANRLAIALVLAAHILGLGMLAIAVGVGDWSGPWPLIMAILGVLGIIFSGLLFGLALLRGREG
ncbi:MAG: AarF/UbiB family protein [Chloroflexales bacterium]|nr:AarF/UbiB family protein [Chloroflexales bacterium]